ncbi:MAG: hypothetical protein RL492_928 [Verrucomicrobiota bacterium]
MLAAFRGRTDEQGLGGLAFQRRALVAGGGFVGFFQNELGERQRMQFRTEDVLVGAVDAHDQGLRREVPAEGRFGGLARVVARGADDEPVDFAFAALRRWVEGAEGFDLVAEEVDAHGHLRVERVDVEDAAAQGVFAGLLAERFVVVAELVGQAMREGPQLERVALADDHLRAGGGLGGGRPSCQRARGAGDEEGPFCIMAAVAQQRQHPEQVAVGLEGRHRGVGLGQRARHGLGAVQQGEELRGLLRQGLGGAEVGGQQDDHAVGGALRASHGRPSVRGHAGQGTAWLNGHPAIECGPAGSSNLQARKVVFLA